MASQLDKSKNGGAESNPSDYETSVVEETQNMDNGKEAGSLHRGGEKKRTAIFQNKVPYASLFRDNHIPDDKLKLEYIPPEEGEFVVHLDEIDTVEQARGFCLVGFATSLRPNAYILMKDCQIRYTEKRLDHIFFSYCIGKG